MEPQIQSNSLARWWIAIATLVAFPCRIWPVGQLGFNQFDEGIYASAASWAHRLGSGRLIEPFLIPYAPPGYPLLVGLIDFTTSLADQSSFLTSAILGTLSVPVVAWLAQKVFDTRAAVITAWCTSLSGPHIAFSRMGLTDATFLCFWSLALVIGLQFLERPNGRTAILLGISVGLAQECKYNGWLAGGIVITTVVLVIFGMPRDLERRRWVQHLLWGGFASGIAAIVVLPWYWFVETHGSYSALLRHQRSYLGGLHQWWPHLQTQMNQAVALSGPIGLRWWTIGLILVSLLTLNAKRNVPTRTQLKQSLLIVCLLFVLLSSPPFTGPLVLIVIGSRLNLSLIYFGCGWIILFVLSPFYHPYARLWLPFEMLHWVALGGLTSWISRVPVAASEDISTKDHSGRGRLIWGGLFALCWIAASPESPFRGGKSYDHSGLLDSTNGLQLAATRLNAAIPRGVPMIRTLVRPALSYYFGQQQRLLPQSDLIQFLHPADPRVWGLIDSTLLTPELTTVSDSSFQRHLEPILDRWEIVATVPVVTSLPTSLDLDGSRQNYARERSMAYLWLLRPRSEAETR